MWNFVPRRIDAGVAVEEALSRGARTLWPDIAALACFVVFFPSALAYRRRLEIHRRLMLLSAISLVPSAMSRMLTLWGLPQLTPFLVLRIVSLFVVANLELGRSLIRLVTRLASVSLQ